MQDAADGCSDDGVRGIASALVGRADWRRGVATEEVLHLIVEVGLKFFLLGRSPWELVVVGDIFFFNGNFIIIFFLDSLVKFIVVYIYMKVDLK